MKNLRLNSSDKKWLLIVIIVAAIIYLMKDCQGNKALYAQKRAYEDTLRVEMDSKGRMRASITSLKLEKEGDLLSIKTKNELIKGLQEEVKETKGKLKSATAFSSTTSISTSVADVKVVPKDTVKSMSDKGETLLTVYPEYSSFVETKWYSISTVATKDSISNKIGVYNEYTAVVKDERNKPMLSFKKGNKLLDLGRHNRVYVKSLNPKSSDYKTDINEVKSFTTEKKTKRFGVGPTAGIDIYGRPTVGLSIQFQLFRF